MLRILWELFINIIEVWIIYDFLIKYFGYKSDSIVKYIYTFMFASATFTEISLISVIIPFETLSSTLAAVINFLFCIYLLKGNIFEKAFISVFIMTVVMIIAILTGFGFSVLSDNNAADIYTVMNLLRMTAMLFTKFILFFVTRFILYIHKIVDLTFYEFFILTTIPVLSLAVAAILIPPALNHPEIQNRSFITIGIIALMNILTFYLFLRAGKAHRVESAYSILQLKYMNEQKQAEELKRMYSEIQSVQHDMKNHLACIDELAKHEKNDYISDYIHEIYDNMLNDSAELFDTGNSILDAVLSIKFSAASRKGVRCTSQICRVEFPMTQSDLGVLIGNILDNACEAAELSYKKKICVQISTINNYINIKVSNTVPGPVLLENPELKTTKKDKKLHGFGTKNIRRIVEKYDGMMRYYEEDDFFYCDIFIPFSSVR